MKKGLFRSMVALLAVPMVGSFLAGCGNDPAPEVDHTYDVTYTAVTINNKDAFADFHYGDADLGIAIAVTPTGIVDQLMSSGRLTIVSSNPEVLTINQKKAHAVKEGTATITVTLANKEGSVTDSVSVEVKEFRDPIEGKPDPVANPVSGTEYKLGAPGYGLTTPAMYYLKNVTEKVGSYYWAIESDFNAAAKVLVEEDTSATDDYKWTIKVNNKYLGYDTSSNSNGEHINDAAHDTCTEEFVSKTHWKWDAEAKMFKINVVVPDTFTTKHGGDYILAIDDRDGKNYEELQMVECASLTGNEEKLDKNVYPCRLYAIPEVLAVEKTEIIWINDVTSSASFGVSKPQGTVTVTLKSGVDCATIDATGAVTAKANGTGVYTITDTQTSIDVTVTVRDALPGEKIDLPMNAQQAIEACSALDGSNKEETTERYYIEGVIVDNPTLDYCNFHYEHEDSQIVVWGLYAAGHEQRYGTERDKLEIPFVKGATVKVYGKLQNYSGTLEITDAELISFENPTAFALTEESTTLCTESEPYTIQYQNASSITCSIKSGDSVTVTEEGVITPVKAGTTIIDVTDGSTTLQFTVTVSAVMTLDEVWTVYQSMEKPSGGSNDTKKYALDGEQVYVSGVIATAPKLNKGRLGFDMKDSNNNVITVYNLNDANNEAHFEADDLYIGDSIVIATAISAYKKDASTACICELQYNSGKAENYLVKFTRGQSSVTSSGDHATVTFTEGVTNDKATNGSTVKFEVAVDSGYELVSVKANGSSLEPTDDVYSFVVGGATEVVVATKQEGSTEAVPTEKSIDLTKGVYSGDKATGQIVWEDSPVTITQTKGSGSSDVNSSYIDGPRFYVGHIVKFQISSGKIVKVEFTYTGKYHGNPIAGTVVSSNTLTSDTTNFTVTVGTSTSGGVDTVECAAGATEFYIQNTSGGDQLRPTAIKVYYVA